MYLQLLIIVISYFNYLSALSTCKRISTNNPTIARSSLDRSMIVLLNRRISYIIHYADELIDM